MVSPVFFVGPQTVFVLYAMRGTCYDSIRMEIYTRSSTHTLTRRRGISFFETKTYVGSAPHGTVPVFVAGRLCRQHVQTYVFFQTISLVKSGFQRGVIRCITNSDQTDDIQFAGGVYAGHESADDRLHD